MYVTTRKFKGDANSLNEGSINFGAITERLS